MRRCNILPFSLSESEKRSSISFAAEHQHPDIEFDFSHILYSYTSGAGIGAIVKVFCSYCGASRDITNYLSW